MKRQLISRRRFLAVSGVAAAWPLPASGQQDAKIRRVAYLNPAFATPVSLAVLEAFRSAMRELGWEESRNIVIESWWGENRPERVRDQAADVVRRHVDLILAAGPAVRIVLATTQRIPIVAVDLEMDPVESGLVASLARPGGNLTGQFLDVPQMCAKHLEMIREVDHRVSRIAVLGDPVVNASQFRAMNVAAHTLSVAVESLELRTLPEDLDRAQIAIKERALQAMVILPSPLANQRSSLIAELALQVRLPSVSLFRTFAESGGLIGYGPNLQHMFRRAADYADRILKGASPANLPVERPVKFDLIVNLKTAQTLGITIPHALLARADEVIE